MTCKHCGAIINGIKCDYCGSLIDGVKEIRLNVKTRMPDGFERDANGMLKKDYGKEMIEITCLGDKTRRFIEY